MKVFIDTSAFVSLFVESESTHAMVAGQYKKYKTNRDQFITSDYILDELFTKVLSQYGGHTLKDIITIIESAERDQDIQIQKIDSVVFSKAKKEMVRFSEHKLSFTDSTTVVLYKDFNLDEIFTLDSDFRKLRLPVSFPRLSF